MSKKPTSNRIYPENGKLWSVKRALRCASTMTEPFCCQEQWAAESLAREVLRLRGKEARTKR